MSALLRILAWVLAIALVVLPVVAVVNGWVGADRWPLTKLRVQGEFKRVGGDQLRAAVLPYARKGFFAVRMDEAQRAVEQLPWVRQAEVRKRWPDVLEVRVVEHKPFARWGDKRLLSEQGSLFATPKGIDASRLPQLGGPDTQVQEVVELYNESRQVFAPLGLDVVRLELDARGSWSLTLDNGTDVIIGRSDARPRLIRFARMLPQLLGQQEQRLQCADLRYTNGFALVWVPAPAHAPASSSIPPHDPAATRNTQALT